MTAPTKPADYQFPVLVETIGDFTFQALSVKQSISLRPLARALYGGPLPGADEPDSSSMQHNLAWFIAELQLALVAAPKDWTFDLYTIDPIVKLWGAYVTARDMFLKTMGIE